MPFTVAIDGPAAAGKGTIARAVAHRFDLGHLDTGLLYRAVGRRSLSGDDPVRAATTLCARDLQAPGLRDEDVSQEASRVSAIPEVRAALLDFQKRFARREEGAVLDGRDVGTVICPEAEVKIFLTASPQERARRRHAELSASNPGLTLQDVLAEMATRDQRDSARSIAPLKPAPDAMLIDTTGIELADLTTTVIARIEQVMLNRASLNAQS